MDKDGEKTEIRNFPLKTFELCIFNLQLNILVFTETKIFFHKSRVVKTFTLSKSKFRRIAHPVSYVLYKWLYAYCKKKKKKEKKGPAQS